MAGKSEKYEKAMEGLESAKRKLDGWKAYSEKAKELAGTEEMIRSAYKEERIVYETIKSEAEEALRKADAEKADATKLKTEAQNFIIAMEKGVENAEEKTEELKEKNELYRLAKECGVTISFTEDELHVRGEKSAQYAGLPEVIPYNVVIKDDEIDEEYEEELEEKAAKFEMPYKHEEPKEQGFDIVEEKTVPQIERNGAIVSIGGTVQHTDEKAKPGPPEKTKYEEADGYRTKDIINFLLELDQNEKGGKDFTEIRDKANLALGLAGKERKNRLDEAKMEYQTEMQERLLSDPHLRLPIMATYELKKLEFAEEDEPEGKEQLTLEISDEAGSIGTAIGKAVAAIAVEKGYEDKLQRQIEEDRLPMTANYYPMQEELSEKEYKILMNSDEGNAFGDMLRWLDDNGKIVKPDFWREGYKIAFSMPKIIFKEMREETKRLQKGGAHAYEVGRVSRRFEDEGRAGLYAHVMGENLKNDGKAEVKKTDKGYAVTVTFKHWVSDSVKNADQRFDEEDESVTLTPEVYEVLSKMPKGGSSPVPTLNWFADYVNSEDKAGRLNKKMLSNSKNLTIPFGAHYDVKLKLKEMHEDMPRLLTVVRSLVEKVDMKKAGKRCEEYYEKKAELLGGKRHRNEMPGRPDGKGKKVRMVKKVAAKPVEEPEAVVVDEIVDESEE